MSERGPDFDELVGPFDESGLDPSEHDRLRHVHELLIAAGPPPELSVQLETPPRERAVVRTRPRPRLRLVAIVASFAVLAFGVGYLAGGGPDYETFGHVTMSGTAAAAGAQATIEVFDVDAAGNWPMEIKCHRPEAIGEREAVRAVADPRRGASRTVRQLPGRSRRHDESADECPVQAAGLRRLDRRRSGLRRAAAHHVTRVRISGYRCVEPSAHSPVASTSCRMRATKSIFPTLVFGSSSRNSTSRGHDHLISVPGSVRSARRQAWRRPPQARSRRRTLSRVHPAPRPGPRPRTPRPPPGARTAPPRPASGRR